MRRIECFSRETGGAAALELAIWASLLVVPVLNVIDVGLYLFQRVQVENAAQMAATAAWKVWPNCTETPPMTPAATTCTAMTDASVLGAHSTSLTNTVTVGTPTIGKYCVEGGAIKAGGTCAGAANASYVTVTVSRSYSPMFGGVSIAGTFSSPITLTAWTRVK